MARAGEWEEGKEGDGRGRREGMGREVEETVVNEKEAVWVAGRIGPEREADCMALDIVVGPVVGRGRRRKVQEGGRRGDKLDTSLSSQGSLELSSFFSLTRLSIPLRPNSQIDEDLSALFYFF